ncbi:MAG: hypothetical protein VYB30_01940 [Candidatus Thermoplasmatota archaeon]|nr:hypothetical protein [Candidatus Thermoplasmatota archaeon]
MIETPFTASPLPDTPTPEARKSGISEIQSLILGALGTPIILALVSILTQTIFLWWILTGVCISAITLIAATMDRRFLLFSTGSFLGTVIFIIPWFFIVDATGLVCYNTYLFFNDVSNC